MGILILALPMSILLFLFLLLLFIKFRSHSNLYTARYAHKHELRHITSKTFPSDGLLIGTTSTHHIVSIRPTETRPEIGNMLIEARSRGGKGILAKPQLLEWKYSAIVNDIKGELYYDTAGGRSTRGDIFVIDFTGQGHSYDPLAGKTTEKDLLAAATTLLFSPDEKEKIFTERATVMLTRMFLAAVKEETPAFPYVKSLINSGLEGAASRLNHVDPLLAIRFLDTTFDKADFTDRFLRSCWSTLTTKLDPILIDPVIRSLTKSDFTPEDILCGEKPVTVYLKWKEQDLQALSPLVRLFWNSLIGELCNIYDDRKGKGCNLLLALLDELGRTKIPLLAEYCSTVAGRGITFWMAIQDGSQLEATYGHADAATIRGNADTQLFYRPNDFATAKILSERMGDISAWASSTTKRNGQETSTGHSERPIPLMSPQEIMRMKDEEIIAFHRDLPPVKLNRMDIRNYPHLKQRTKIAPPPLPSLPPVADIPMHSAGRETATSYFDPDEVL